MKKTVLVLCVLGVSASSAFAHDQKMMMMTMTPEQRQKMATTHEAMALCLKSERPLPECKDEMMKSCMDTMGKEGCHMEGKGKRYGK